MSEILFSIDQLACSYSREVSDKVLYIESLQIPKGKIVFLLGASGCGKSTLLETLGLMNNTIASGKLELSAGGSDGPIPLPDLWLEKNEARLTDVRKKYYSFIFQNTNLMENFTAYENVCLSGMIKENVTQESVLPEAKVLMEKIKLPEYEVNLETLAVNLSGGQRQRLAFARAFNNKATVLFGDEPTGNLDEANANELFGIIKSNLSERLSAIIVSHDINLAVKYADQIIVITKDQSKNYGEVKRGNIFNRKEWESYSESETVAFKGTLRSLYNVANEHKVLPKIGTSSNGTKVNTSFDYHRLFFKREGTALLGKKMSNFFILLTILFFTFLAIGFANGSLDYLNKQLNDAFVNWITVTIPMVQSETSKVVSLVDELNADSVKNKFNYQGATAYVRSALSVWDPALKRFNLVKSRSIDTADGQLLHDFILNRDNIIRGALKDGFKENDIAVIVTRRFLSDFNYPEDADFIYCSLRVKDSLNHVKDIGVPVQIRAIVKVLPEKRQLIYPLFFYSAFMRENDPTFDTTARKNNFSIFYNETDDKKANEFKKSLQEFLSSDPDYKKYASSADPYQSNDTVGYKPGFKYEVSFDSTLEEAVVVGLVAKTLAALKGKFDRDRVFRVYDYNVTNVNKYPTFDGISFYFRRLDSVRAFSRYLLNRSDAKSNTDIIEVDESTLKDKENFNFLSYVTKVISFLLIIFSALSVCLFIYNLLKSHLSKVKINIGTFKAIGLTDKEARRIYFSIILYFTFSAILVAFVLALIVGTFVNLVLVGMNNINNISYFKILDFSDPGSAYNIVTIVTILWIIICALVLSRITIRKILSRTPGDLIYNR